MLTKQAVILLGGKGTRLSKLYPDLPKALAPVSGRPFLSWHLMGFLIAAFHRFYWLQVIWAIKFKTGYANNR